jgi:hypothetical protein
MAPGTTKRLETFGSPEGGEVRVLLVDEAPDDLAYSSALLQALGLWLLIFCVRLRRDSVPYIHSRGIDWLPDTRENIPSDHPSRIGPGKQASRRLAAIQSSVAPSFGKTDIMTSQAALFVNPCPTSKERLAHSHARPQPADFRNSAMDVRDEPREVAMCSLTTGR